MRGLVTGKVVGLVRPGQQTVVLKSLSLGYKPWIHEHVYFRLRFGKSLIDVNHHTMGTVFFMRNEYRHTEVPFHVPAPDNYAQSIVKRPRSAHTVKRMIY